MPPLEQADSDILLPTSLHSIQLSESGSENKKQRRDDKSNRHDHQSKKRVFFCTSVKYQSIKSHNEFSKDRKQRVWYSSDEAKRLRKEAIDTVRKMAENKPLSQNETSRGLENKTPKELSVRREEIRDIIGFVLDEQSRFFTPVVQDSSFSSLGNDDNESDFYYDEEEIDGPAESHTNSEYLAALYRHYNRKYVSEAIRLAAMDAAEVWGV